MKNEELENRLIDFSVTISKICQPLNKSELGRILSQQLIRSSTSTALNYGESRGAESRKDFIHKLRIVLKEMRESHVSLRIIERAKICRSTTELEKTIDECNQLIAIFVATIRTAENKKLNTS